MCAMKRVSVSFVLRLSGFQRAAEVEISGLKSLDASSLRVPRPTAAPDSQQVLCASQQGLIYRQDRSRSTVLCPNCYLLHRIHKANTLRVFLPTNILLSPKLLFATGSLNRFYFFHGAFREFYLIFVYKSNLMHVWQTRL